MSPRKGRFSKNHTAIGLSNMASPDPPSVSSLSRVETQDSTSLMYDKEMSRTAFYTQKKSNPWQGRAGHVNEPPARDKRSHRTPQASGERWVVRTGSRNRTVQPCHRRDRHQRMNKVDNTTSPINIKSIPQIHPLPLICPNKRMKSIIQHHHPHP
ncbi:hypothetical protein BU16DRAFT_119979 [Lophium mytilinum]|uniref:Uncharacterized protein n=1 Tax=Lophium mytilinum TaxID=390894 RepID=A0A6A6QGF9_9PEZI|nr:hypothetical protein BU16DRAFT_119979 [Lophium mytilinum]